MHFVLRRDKSRDRTAFFFLSFLLRNQPCAISRWISPAAPVIYPTSLRAIVIIVCTFIHTSPSQSWKRSVCAFRGRNGQLGQTHPFPLPGSQRAHKVHLHRSITTLRTDLNGPRAGWSSLSMLNASIYFFASHRRFLSRAQSSKRFGGS